MRLVRGSLLPLGILAIANVAIATKTSEEAALLRRDAEWSAISSKGKNVSAIVAFWTDDATIYPPGAPTIRGKAAIQAYIQQSLAMPGFRISWKPERATVSRDGTLGYTTGTNSVTVPGKDGKPMTIIGRYVTTWKRISGVWRCTVDISNTDH